MNKESSELYIPEILLPYGFILDHHNKTANISKSLKYCVHYYVDKRINMEITCHNLATVSNGYNHSININTRKREF